VLPAYCCARSACMPGGGAVVAARKDPFARKNKGCHVGDVAALRGIGARVFGGLRRVGADEAKQEAVVATNGFVRLVYLASVDVLASPLWGSNATT